ncbi:MAG: hypothetical protein HOO96_20485 [Polyangiaceae bacterium]|nr:hypothetical protein [Polyangiaceae bacterium]
MPERAPAVRASAVRDTLAFLDKFEPGARERVLARVPAASRDLIENTARSYWVPIEHDHYTVDAMVAMWGVERSIQCWRGAMANLVERPLLKSFVSGMVGLFGSDPRRVLGLLPRGWPLVYRDMTLPRVAESRPGRLVIAFEDAPELLRVHSNYFHSFHGACLGIADIARLDGQVDFAVTRQRTAATATFSWAEPQ